MKILMLAGFFPPHAPLAATRAPSFARFLLRRGHDIRVVAADNPDWPPVSGHGLPEGVVRFTPVDLAQGKDRPSPQGASHRAWGWFAALAAYPDKRIGWLPHALAAATEIMAEWRPDVIFATAPPFTTLLAAALLSRQSGVPWVAEYRDLWTDHPYYTASGARRLFDRLLDRRLLHEAAACVTVTRDWAERLRSRIDVPVCLAMNGFDPDEFEALPAHSPGPGLTLLYCGALYQGKRDPAPVLEALARLGPSSSIRFDLYVDDPGPVLRQAACHGIDGMVFAHPPVERHRVLALQRAADLCVLLRWDDPREDSVIPGKVFEYVGAGRPILAIGRPTGEVAELITRDHLGTATSDPNEIARTLSDAIATKARLGTLPSYPEAVRCRYTRSAQFEGIQLLLARVAKVDSARPLAHAPVGSPPPAG